MTGVDYQFFTDHETRSLSREANYDQGQDSNLGSLTSLGIASAPPFASVFKNRILKEMTQTIHEFIFENVSNTEEEEKTRNSSGSSRRRRHGTPLPCLCARNAVRLSVCFQASYLRPSSPLQLLPATHPRQLCCQIPALMARL